MVKAVRQCQVHGYHYPAPIRVIEHHIWPEGMGGPDTPENQVDVCDTGHFNIHRLMGYLLKGMALPKRLGTRTERRLAQRGYDEWIAAGKPGKPVFEVW